MIKIRAALVAMTSMVAGTAIAGPLGVVTLTDLHEQGQPAQLQEIGGDCQYYGSVEEPTAIIIEVRVCPTGEGALEQSPYPAVVNIDGLPVPAGTHVDLTSQ